MKLILSTLSSPQTVCITKKQGNGSLKIVKRIHINGGANVADRKTLLTPAGVVTELTDEDYEMLIASDFYKRQNAAGFLRPVETKAEAEEPTKKGMNKRDKSAQKTQADYEKGKTPIVQPSKAE